MIIINVPGGEGDNKLVVLEGNESTDNVEIAHWHEADKRGLEKIKRQAEREGGQFLILSPGEGSAVALSALPSDVSSDGKVTTLSSDKQAPKAESIQLGKRRGKEFSSAIRT